MAPEKKRNSISKETVSSGLKTNQKQMPSLSGFGMAPERARISRAADAQSKDLNTKIAADSEKYGGDLGRGIGNKREQFDAKQRQRYETPGVMKKGKKK